MLAALFAALLFGALATPPAFAATRSSGPSPGTDLSQQLAALQQKAQQQQATINSLADQEESEYATLNALNSKVQTDLLREQTLHQQLDRVARIEYERPALTLTTIMAARNLGELLSGIAQARVISHQQQQMLSASAALKASDQKDQAAAQAELTTISKQQSQATAIAANIQSEISTVQTEQQAAPAAPQSAPASKPAAPQTGTPTITGGAAITLKPGPSNPNRFYPGQCVWYVAQIYSIPWLGNADQWPAAAAADGQAEGQTPVVGAIMESADSAFGHVSVVISVTDYNHWTVTEMNYSGGPFVTDTRHVTRATSNLVTFIY